VIANCFWEDYGAQPYSQTRELFCTLRIRKDNLLHCNRNDIESYAFLPTNYTEDHSNVRPKRDVNAETLINSQLAHSSVQYWRRKSESRKSTYTLAAFLESPSSIIIISDVRRFDFNNCKISQFPYENDINAHLCHSLVVLEKTESKYERSRGIRDFPDWRREIGAYRFAIRTSRRSATMTRDA